MRFGKKSLIVLIMVSFCLNRIFLESKARILFFINFTCLTGVLEQQYILTAKRVVQFQAGEELDMESNKAPVFLL
jgi:hypothetical protein